MVNRKNDQLIESYNPVYSVVRLVTKIFYGFFVFPVRMGLKYVKKTPKKLKIYWDMRVDMRKPKKVFNLCLVIKILFY
jgi:hypothetical protein